MAIERVEDLRVFVQVVDSGNLTAAGRVLGLSAPLVSRRLARLEEGLGVRLIQRTTRTMSITDEGRTFYGRCRRILADLEAAEAEVRPVEGAVEGTVRVVLPTSLLAYGVMESLRTFLDATPRLTVDLQLSDGPVDLVGGGWDVATHIAAPPDSTHIARRLCHLSPRFAATSEYLARHGIPELPADLSQHRCLRFAGAKVQTHFAVIDAEGVSQRVPVGGSLICRDILSMYTAICAGVGIGVVPLAVLQRDHALGLLTPVLPRCRSMGNDLFALIPAERHRLPRVRAFTDWLAEFMQALNG
jgi:DNA-binding transcriptional LysR family regulator